MVTNFAMDFALVASVAKVLMPVFALIAAGYIYARLFSADIRTANEMNMRLFVPALVFDSLTQKNFDISAYPWILVAAVIVVLGSGVLALPVARALKQSPASFVPPMMFNNCGNMGLPVALLAFGQPGLQVALVLFMVSNLLHFTLGVRIVSGRMHFKEVFFNAVNVASVLGIVVSLRQISVPEVVTLPISMAGQVAIPLMLVSLGVRMTGFNKQLFRIGLVGALLRPFAGLVFALLAIWLLPLGEFEQKLLLLFAVMPPAVLNYLFAERYAQSPEVVASMVIVGNAISIVVLYFCLLLIF